MSKKNKTQQLPNGQMAAENAVIITTEIKTNLPLEKRKEDAEQILYFKRI